MTEWIYRAGQAPQGPWFCSLGAHDSTTVVDGWKHTGLRAGDFADGDSVTLDAAPEERIVIPLSGDYDVTVDGTTYSLAGRESVFHGTADVLYTGIEAAATITARGGGRLAIASAPAKAEFPVRHLRKEDIPVELRGAGQSSRQVQNFGTPATLEADRFIVCEVITPSSNWSSYPPHKHDEEKEGETQLEEIYYFETRVSADAPEAVRTSGTADSHGYQRVYASDERPIDVATEVRSGDVVLVPYGWHGPAMASPGYDLYYLNVMAGPGPVREWLISDDPHHGWVRQTWESLDIDPRLPFTA